MTSRKNRSRNLAALLSTVTLLISCSVAAQVDAADQGQVAPDRRKNVLFIIADDLNVRLGRYGDPIAITPNLDALAARGVQFSNVYAQFPWCSPSRTSLLTGLRPDTTGVVDLNTHFRDTRPDAVTLPEYFREAGYFSARVGKIYHQGVPGGVGEDGLDDPRSWDVAINPKGWDKEIEGDLVNLMPGFPLGAALTYYADGSGNPHTDHLVTDETRKLLERNREKRFFIAAGYYRPHVPEVAPASYFELYDLADIDEPDSGVAEGEEVLPAALQWMPPDFGMTLRQQREFVRAYLAAVSFVDAQVGELLEALGELELEDNTIVVFTSDHGFLLGEYDQWGKQTLWEETNRVPLIIYDPDADANGAITTRVVELVDLYPTLAELAGLEVPEGVEGESVASLLEDPDAEAGDGIAYSQVVGGRSVRNNQWRYTLWEGGRLGRELYSMTGNNAVVENLAGNPAFSDIEQSMARLIPAHPDEQRVGHYWYLREDKSFELRPIPTEETSP